jgi:prolyl 4-hydroxylase
MAMTVIDTNYHRMSIKQSGTPNMDHHLKSVNLLYPGIRAINSNPPIFEIDDFLSPEQCANLISHGEESTYLGGLGSSQTFSGSKTTSTRTSSTCHLPFESTPELLKLTNLLTGVDISHYEEPQICKYTQGQRYSWHYDSIPMGFRKGWGNRVATLIVYLNTLSEKDGGATIFKDLDLTIQPKMGKALLFFPSYEDGNQDDRTLHSGAICETTKYIANVWIHEGSYDSAI